MTNKSLHQIFFILLFLIFSVKLYSAELIYNNTTSITDYDQNIILKVKSLESRKNITKIELKIFKISPQSEIYNLNKDGSITVNDGNLNLSAILIIYYKNNRDIKSINISADSSESLINKLVAEISKLIS